MPGSTAPTHGVPPGRLLLGVVGLPGLLVGGTWAWAAAVRSRLPEPLATHFGFDGRANGFMTFAAFLASTLPVALIPWAIGAVAVVVGRSARVRFRTERVAMAWCSGSAAFAASVVAITVAANLDQGRATAVTLPGVSIAPVLLVAALFAVVGWMLAGKPPALPALPVGPPEATGAGGGTGSVPAMVIEPGTHPVWQHRQRAAWMLTLAGLAAVAAAVLVLIGQPTTAVVSLIVALGMAPFGSIDVVVDGTGLTIRFGPLGWPRRHIGLDDIAAVSAEDIEPLEWGGWGYRMVPGKSAVVLRRGPAIVVRRTDGRAFAVTVDDPEAGAALLDAYRRRAS